MRNIGLDDFRNDIATIDHLNDTSIDLNSMTVNFNTYLISLLNKHAPVCRKYMRAETNTPWYNNTLLTAKRCKRQLERKWRRLQTDVSRQTYRAQCISLNKLLYISRVNYYSNKITEGGRNTKTLFKIAKELTGHNENPILPSHNDHNILVNEFCEYFCDKVKKIRDGITIDLSKSPPPETLFSGDKLTTLQILTPDEVKHLIESSPTKSCDLDPIPTWLVKECMLELLPLITATINNSVTSGVYPCLYRYMAVYVYNKSINHGQHVGRSINTIKIQSQRL